MDYKELWEEVCFYVNDHKNDDESKLQIVAEYIFDKLGWKKYKNEITRPSIQFGASNYGIPDIILSKDNEEVICVELKRYLVCINEKNAAQLISYMRQRKLSFGLLFGRTMQIYYDKIDDNKPPLKICELIFNKENKIGIELIQQLYKDNFSKKNFEEFCFKKLESKKKEKEFNEKQNFLCSPEGVKYVKDLLLIEYPEEVINELDFKISRKKEPLKIIINDINKFPKNSSIISENSSLSRDENEPVQDWIKRVLIYLVKNNLLTEVEIERLHDKEYSKDTFGIQFPLLCDDKNDTLISGNRRYWTKWTLGEYFVCSQWWKDKEDVYEELITKWINKITK